MKDQNQKPMSEDKSVAVSYIMNYYLHLNNLNHWYSLLLNTLAETGNKYNDETIKELNEDDARVLKAITDNIRYYTNQIYILYKAIFVVGLRKAEDPEIRDNREHINTVYFPQRGHIERYVMACNRVIMDDVVKNFLQTNQEILEGLYGNK